MLRFTHLTYQAAIGVLMAILLLTICLFIINYFVSYSKKVRNWNHFWWCFLDNGMVCFSGLIFCIGCLFLVVNLIVQLMFV